MSAERVGQWCKTEGCSQRDGHEGEHRTNGVDAKTWAKVHQMPVPEFGDHWSCAMRPGSWEWFTDEAHVIRTFLMHEGYERVLDPGRSWGVSWRRKIKLLAVERRRAMLRKPTLALQMREIPVGFAFNLEDGGPDYRVIELKVKGRRVYATVEQVDGYGAGRFTVNMSLRDHVDYPGELVAVLPLT